MHKNLKKEFKNFKSLYPNLKNIIDNLSKLVSDEALLLSKWYFQKNQIGESKKYINISVNENQKNYGAWLFKAIIDFKIDKNTDQALLSIKYAKNCNPNSMEWRYSEAFLYFWKEDYNKALNICTNIKRKTFDEEKNTLREVREFNLNILKENETKIQIHFYNGYLSLFKEHNYANALIDFENFEKLANSNMQPLKQRSKNYLIEIKKKLGV